MRTADKELLLISLFMGFSASIIQVLLIREILTLCRGNELIIGMIFFSWFLGIYAGAFHKRSQRIAGSESRVLISLFSLPVLAAISIYASKFIRIFFPGVIGTFYSFSYEVIIAVLFTLPVSFFIGFYFPSLVALISKRMGDQSGGVIFYLESMGGFAGGLFFSFVLVDLVNPLGIISVLVLPAIAVAFSRRNPGLLALFILPLVIILYSNKIEYKIFKYIWDKSHTGELIQYKRTKYQLVEAEAYDNTVSIYGDGILMYTLPDGYEARGIFHLIQSLRQGHSTILLMGSPGSLLYNLSKTETDLLYYFETDPDLWGIIRPYISSYYEYAELEKKIIVPNQDLRRFLKENRMEFDMIVILPPNPENIMLNRFYTQDFYSLCREHLSKRGIFITSLHGFSNYMSDELRNYIASVYAGFAKEFPLHMKTSGETMYLIGGKSGGILPESADKLVKRYKEAWDGADNHSFEREIRENFSPDELRTFFENTQLEYFDGIMAPIVKSVEANRDLKPGTYWRNILFTLFRERSVLYNIIRNPVFILGIILILSLAALVRICRRSGSSSLAKGFLMYLNGFISISTMTIVILIYQNSRGIIYHRISLITALFMLGLSAGSFAFNRKSLRLPYIFISIGIVLGFLLAFAVDYNILYWLLIFIFSFMCGGVFPTLFKSGNTGDFYNAASVLDSMDHFGSIAGSMLTVAFLLPAFGIQGAIMTNILLIIPACIIGFARFS